MIFKNLCILVLWTKVASALERLTKLSSYEGEILIFYQKTFKGSGFKTTITICGLDTSEV